MTAHAAFSRRFAAGLVVVSGDAGARDLVAWMAALTPAAVGYPATGTSARVPLATDADQAVCTTPAALMRDAGIDRMARLMPGLGRMCGTRLRLLGLDGMEVDAMTGFGSRVHEGLVPVAATEPAAAWFTGWLLSEAHIEHDEAEDRDPVVVDLDRMRGMRCRYSPVLHLRALAWLAGGVPMRKGWRRRTTAAAGGVTVGVPFEDVGLALGAAWIRSRRDADQLVLGPAVDELREAGIELRPRWTRHPGYARVYDGLVLELAPIAADKRPRRMPDRPRA